MQKKKPTVAIIGGGISGLTVSQLLQSEFDITLFEKARGLGGRLATTYNNDNCQYDIGAQFFTSKTAAFSDFLKPYIENQNIQCWCGSFLEIKKSMITKQSEWTADYPHWVAAPKMTSICKSMAKGADIRLNHKVTQLKRENNKIKI